MRLATFALLAALCTACADRAPEPVVERVTVFRSGAEGYPSIRIPSVVTTRSGAVLAFAEGRMRPSDHAENDIILKRSSDAGRTWSELQVIAEDGRNCLNNPQAVVLPSGRVLLMYQVFPEHVHSVKMGDSIGVAAPGYEGPDVQRSFLIWSDDDGRTWSEPRDVTRQVKRPNASALASGPGIGIVLRRGPYKGRIVMPFNETVYPGEGREPIDRIFHVYAAFSDDGGETWRYGHPAPHEQNLPGQAGWGNEVQMVELIDGSILLNSRSYRGAKLRKVAVSTDGGETWSPLKDDPQLPEPQCMGSIFRYSDPLDGETSRILFSSPASQTARTLGIIRLSYDEGTTWPVSRVLVPEGEFFAYSCLTRLPDGAIGCLYEADDYGRIVFARIPLAWLTP